MTSEVVTFVVKIHLFFSVVNGYSFITKDVLTISLNSSSEAYFSYSLLLQRGDIPVVIVGAPKKNITYFKENSIETVYKCTLNKQTSCEKILFNDNGRVTNSKSTNGNFFGMSLDGENDVNGALVACAPRPVTKTVNYLRGYCIYMQNTSQVTEPPLQIAPLNNGLYRDTSSYKYYDFAFAMAGFDVSFYPEKKEVLLGAPGVKKFNGATISYSLDEKGASLLPSRHKPVLLDEDIYFGYSVKTAKFKRNSNETWFIAGAPRSNDLKGKVTIFFYDVMSKEKTNIVATFHGEEFASYFGASILALDVTNDGILDFLVGAPMAAGKTWDEGYVYFYKGLSETSFERKAILTGSHGNGSRFGSVIVSLGDFDLDGFNDVAISAPYEDNGRGAVYIYKGSLAGLADPWSQRLSPIDFKVHNAGVKGFGMGLSRGNDIDGNGHNDIAIGAYKSDQVFIVKSYSIIDYDYLLTPNITIISNDTTFVIQFCLWYTKRSPIKNILPQVNFSLSFDLDYRSVTNKIDDLITVNRGKTTCKIYLVQIRPIITDILPFQIELKLNTKMVGIIAHGKTFSELKIPYSHGCGSDNMCVTDLSVELEPKNLALVLGKTKTHEMTVKVNNYGEPAYQCEVIIDVPDGISLGNNRGCTRTNGTYTCLIDDRLIDFNQKKYVLDVGNIKPDISVIKIGIKVTSLFNNKGGDKNRATLTIPVILESSPLLTGKSVPETMKLEIKSFMNDLEVLHQFSVQKTGPSPLKLNVDILLPAIEHNGENILNILEVKGYIDTVQIPCIPFPMKNETYVGFNGLRELQIPLNRTILLTCTTGETCQRYTCQGEYLYNSGQVAIFEARTSIRSKLLVSKYKTDLTIKDLVIFLPVLFQNGSSTRVATSSVLSIFVHAVYIIPLWVYLAAPAIGVILVLLLSYCLYWCHFFDRVYKDKLDQQKILEAKDASVEEEIFIDVFLRSMEAENFKLNKTFQPI